MNKSPETEKASRQNGAASRHTETSLHPLEWRIRQLRRKFTRGRGRKCTWDEAMAVDKAAKWRALSDAALLDLNTTHNDRVRLDSAARHAEREMWALLDREEPERLTLGEMFGAAE